MEIAGIVGILIIVGIAIVVAIVLLLILLLFARSWIKVARADEALVISGRKQKVQRTIVAVDGSTRGETEESPVTVIVNGKSLVNPITQRHEIISLRSRQVSLNAEAQSLDSVTLNVDGVAIVKIGSDPLYVRRAAERFASQDKAIEQFTTEQLEGALREREPDAYALLAVAAVERDVALGAEGMELRAAARIDDPCGAWHAELDGRHHGGRAALGIEELRDLDRVIRLADDAVVDR